MTKRVLAAGLLTLLLLALGIAAVALASEKVPRVRPYRLHFLGPEKQLLPHDQKITFREKGVTLGLQMLDARQRLVFFRERLDLDQDPFYGSFGDPKRFVSFRLVIAPSADQIVYFHPQQVRLISDKNEHIYPLDVTRTYQLLRTLWDKEPPPEYLDALTSVMFDVAEEVQPGRVVEKLLIFKEPRQDTEEWVLDLPFLQVGKEQYSFRAAWAKEFLDEE
jgi:hypothetical protein